MNQPLILLASASERRAELLAQIGVPFVQQATNVDETPLPHEAPQDYVQRLSLAKCMAALETRNECIVLGSDTSVVVDHTILGKPIDQQDHARMFAQLSGRTHHVYTGVSVADATRQQTLVSVSEVTFTKVTADDAMRYWNTGEPVDKAGGYAVQGLAAVFVEQLNGSYSGVMGLPLHATAQLLEAFGVAVWQNKEMV